ncbi:unnamed protein product [Withania somnifera]
MEKHNFFLTLFFLIQYYFVSISVASSNETDQAALLAFRDLITSPSPFLANNWTKNTSFCSWFGVTCSSKRQRVVALALPNLQLQGTISPFWPILIDIQNNQLQGSIPTRLFQHQKVQKISLALNELSGEMLEGPWYVCELRVLNLSRNSLMGTIPPSVGNASKLLKFSLSDNRINGNIPKEIGNLSQIAELSLAHNQLTGSIPVALFNTSSLLSIHLLNNSLSGPFLIDEGNIVSNLEFLSISQNQISGFIPSNICQLSVLKVLSISLNNIIGEIPKNIGCLSKLEELYLGDNIIEGMLTTSLGNISTLQYLYCGNNRIVGQVPPELGKLSNLRQLSLNDNNLTGQIPKGIFNISSLEIIDFSSNNLSGRIPPTTGLHLPNLKGLGLAVNKLEGKIPLFITNASKLQTLVLAHNFLTGTIPTNLGNLRELRALLLHENQLTNEPRESKLRFFNSLADCRMLQSLQVGSNPLNSILPNSIGNLSSTIEYFHIADALINGIIPTGMGNISALTALSFRENNLTGSIPSDVGKLKQLQGLYLTKYKLQGHIPEAVCHLSNLVELTLDFNELSGLIPECIGNLNMLQHLYLGSNKFSLKLPLSLWKMSGLLYLSVSRNSIEGEVPSDIGELKAIVALYLYGNHFSGKIPGRLGELLNLQSLYLSNNSFFGQIPLSFSNLISLEFLDLSLNALSGTIPKSLEKLSLKSINVSFNNLEGEIPSGGVFANSTLESFLGNKGLCGSHIFEVPACAITNLRQQSKSKKLVLKIVTPVVTSSFMIFLLVSISIIIRQKKGKPKGVEKVLEIRAHQLVSYHEIQRATNNFDESNLIGKGSSSFVYKGTLSSGIMVAIKVLNLENEQVCKRFDTECEVMRNVRHRNLVAVITICSSDYIRAFILQYMTNGSLEDWLYRENRHLNLLQRVTIMLDVAVAIEYLHHGNDTPIAHCDLKPANVLLDEGMVGHVGDFGISKILALSKSMTHTETLGTLGYIAPEYGSEGIVSTSGDVYSYGIILMEICNENLDLRKWITEAFPRTMMEIVDAYLFSGEEQITSRSEICIASMIELALDCTKEMPESRITMKDVVKRLNKVKKAFLET